MGRNIGKNAKVNEIVFRVKKIIDDQSLIGK
jgi:hypothetical protein